MSKGYISLFFEDSGYSIPQQDELENAKKQIWTNYKNRFNKPNLQDQQDLQSFVDNSILLSMGQNLTENGQNKMSNPIEYWGISVGQAYSIIKGKTDLLAEIGNITNFIENAQNIIADALTACNGIVNQSLIDQLKQEKQTLANIAGKFGGVSSDESFKGLFWGSLRGALNQAQGTLHEVAAAVAAASAKQKVEKELAKGNQEIQVIVEATGGKMSSDSELMNSLSENDIETGSTNNAKNDLTIAVKDGNGKILWTTGLSLKSTSSKSPTFVHIVSTSLSTLLNKIYSQDHYLNIASGLGVNDWAGTRKGIATLANKHEISTPTEEILKGWQRFIYGALYNQIIDMFNGTGEALNNAQYLIVNAQVQPMYNIFSTIEQMQTDASLFSITGIKISGLGSDHGASIRRDIVSKNVAAFRRLGNGLTPADARIERSSEVWDYAYNKINGTKISISLKYNELFSGNTR